MGLRLHKGIFQPRHPLSCISKTFEEVFDVAFMSGEMCTAILIPLHRFESGEALSPISPEVPSKHKSSANIASSVICKDVKRVEMLRNVMDNVSSLWNVGSLSGPS